MKRALLASMVVGLAGCGLHKDVDPTQNMVTVGVGVVESAGRIRLDNNQGSGGRYADAVLLGGVTGLVVTSIAESESANTNAWQYAIRLKSGENAQVKTFSVVQVGDCVLVRREGPDGPASLVRQTPDACR